MKFKGKVTKEFIDRRNQKVEEDDRDMSEKDKQRQWDFEFVEHHQAAIPNSGHEVYEGYEYDTVHSFFGNCDFKHVNRYSTFSISKYIQKQLRENVIDTIVLWQYAPHPHLWHENLQEGDFVKYEILDYLSRDEVLAAIDKSEDIKGYKINVHT